MDLTVLYTFTPNAVAWTAYLSVLAQYTVDKTKLEQDMTESLSYNCSPSATVPVPLHPAVAPCDLARWRTPCEVWDRCSPGWGLLTLV